MDSLPTVSTPRDADDDEVGSREGTHQEEEAPEVSQDNLPDFAPDSAPEPTVAPESGGRPLRKKGKTVTPTASVQPKVPDNLLEALHRRGTPHCYECGDSEGAARQERADRSLQQPSNRL